MLPLSCLTIPVSNLSVSGPLSLCVLFQTDTMFLFCRKLLPSLIWWLHRPVSTKLFVPSSRVEAAASLEIEARLAGRAALPN